MDESVASLLSRVEVAAKSLRDVDGAVGRDVVAPVSAFSSVLPGNPNPPEETPDA